MNRKAAPTLWSSTVRLTGALLALWLAVNLLGTWFARDLDRLLGSDFHFGFWVAAEGTLLLYLGIIVWYAVAMDRLEQQYLASEETAHPSSDTVAK